MKTIKLTIQEIVKDFYKLADMEGYMSGLAECYELSEKNKDEYYYTMKEMIKKYIPTYKEYLSKEYKSLESYNKGLELSSILYKNFEEIFYKLV